MSNKNIYLGVNLLHDTSAAILRDGELIAAVEQERFDGCRHSTNFPRDAIDFCLHQASITIEQVSAVGVTFDYSAFALNNHPFEQNTVNHDDMSKEGRQVQHQRNMAVYRSALDDMRASGLGNFVTIRHHLCHAAGTFFSSGFDRANILVVDGRGEDECTSLYLGDGLSINKLKSYEIKDSLGHLYTYVTSLCGLYNHIGQEGKTMGLAPYGTGKLSLLDSVLKFESDRYRIDREAMRSLKKYANRDIVFSDESKELAFAVQKALEEAFAFLAEDLYAQTGVNNFCLSGGVTLNCNANARLAQLPFVEKLYLQPAANDAGTAVGAAMVLHAGATGTRPVVREQVYLGPSFTDDEIEAYLQEQGLSYQKLLDPALVAAELIHAGKIIGWCQGAAEFGPRALGNRSILASPCSATIRDKVNVVKQRENWRPLAPSVLAEQAGHWFSPTLPSPHMLLTLNVLPEKRNVVPGITHVDGTARVQTVEADANPLYHRLISCLFDLSGVPMVMNTSLNTKGQPIVRTPADCIECLYESGLDAIIVGDMIVYNERTALKRISEKDQAINDASELSVL